MNTEVVEIFVELLDEGVNVWRPVPAISLGEGRFRIPSTLMIPEDECWAFQPGEIVRCEDHIFAGGTHGLLAIAKVSTSA